MRRGKNGILAFSEPRLVNIFKDVKNCSSAPENQSDGKNSKKRNLKEQANEIESVIKDNQHKIDPNVPKVSDEECKLFSFKRFE